MDQDIDLPRPGQLPHHPDGPGRVHSAVQPQKFDLADGSQGGGRADGLELCLRRGLPRQVQGGSEDRRQLSELQLLGGRAPFPSADADGRARAPQRKAVPSPVCR